MSEIPVVGDIELLLDRREMDELDREATRNKVVQMLKKLKNGKAAGMIRFHMRCTNGGM